MTAPAQHIDSILRSDTGSMLAVGRACPVVISTRIRLARNLAGHRFPACSSSSQRIAVLNECLAACERAPSIGGASVLRIDDLSSLERLILVERYLISRELMNSKGQAGVVADPQKGASVMINEEDHLRIQMLCIGFDLHGIWTRINTLDDELEAHLDYAFSRRLGYLTSCPTNLGTAIRASAMMHLPGLVLAGYMEQVIRMVNQLGIAVRGHFGEGSEATGSIFQISNQQTLGEDEETIINRLHNVLESVIEQEMNARQTLMEEKPDKLLDKIGRARGVLQNGHRLSSEEAMEMLSLTRLAADMGALPEGWRATVDNLMVVTQPGHMQYRAQAEIGPSRRDVLRANIMREEFANMPPLTNNSNYSEVMNSLED